MRIETKQQIKQTVHNLIQTTTSDTYVNILLTSKDKTTEKTMMDEIIDDLTNKQKTQTYTTTDIKESIGRVLSKRIGIK